MFSRIDSWSEKKRLNAGVWCSPLLMWTLYGVQILLMFSLDQRTSDQINGWLDSDWGLATAFVTTCVFWLACAAFTGLCAAFFWLKIDLDAQAMTDLTLRSVSITWAPTLICCCAWVFLWLPFLIYLFVFRIAVDQGLKFWNSNRPREWIGDFSNPDTPDDK